MIKHLEVNGRSVHVEVTGQGPPLLLHSGVWAGVRSWDPLLPYLDGFRVIAFDPPGIGGSSAPAFPLTMAELAAVGAGVLDELGIGSAHVLGVSFGGAVAQQMAIGYPARVRSLVLASTIFGTPGLPGDARALWHFLNYRHYSPERLEQVAGVMFGGRLRTEPGLIHELRIASPAGSLAAVNRVAALYGWSSLLWLWTIRQPTLILAGDDDPITPRLNHQVIAGLMPDARLETIRGGGHLMLLDSPDRIGPLISRFLRGQPAAPSLPLAG
jgi:poly(3-hydroxyoctanoate) depolymerase